MSKTKKVLNGGPVAMLARQTPRTLLCGCDAPLVVRMGGIKECEVNGPTCSGRPPGTTRTNLQIMGAVGWQPLHTFAGSGK